MRLGRFHLVAIPLVLGFLGCGAKRVTSGGAGGTGKAGAGGTDVQGGSSGTGGATSSGGGAGSGGVPSTGRGGATGSGGALSTGGAAVGGGVTGSGGAPGTGGVPGSGGMAGTSGTATAGGSTGSGGVLGSGGSHDGGPAARDAADANTPDAGGGAAGGFDPCPVTGDCKILPLGDSITAGAGAQPGDNGGYRVELFTKAVADSKHITFVGSMTSGPSTVSGQTFPKNHEGHIGWKIDQVDGIATTSQALKDMPQIVLLFIGTNDEGYASSAAGASDRLGQLIDKIVAALPNALLVVSSIYPFPGCKDTNYTSTQCAANVTAYDATMPGVIQQRVAQGKHLLSVDMSTPPTGALSTDGVHPNDTVGYPWMGDTWYSAIKSYLH